MCLPECVKWYICKWNEDTKKQTSLRVFVFIQSILTAGCHSLYSAKGGIFVTSFFYRFLYLLSIYLFTLCDLLMPT